MTHYLTVLDIARRTGKAEATVRGWKLPTPDATAGDPLPGKTEPRSKMWLPETFQEWWNERTGVSH